jgi:hypothetical protein
LGLPLPSRPKPLTAFRSTGNAQDTFHWHPANSQNRAEVYQIIAWKFGRAGGKVAAKSEQIGSKRVIAGCRWISTTTHDYLSAKKAQGQALSPPLRFSGSCE